MIRTLAGTSFELSFKLTFDVMRLSDDGNRR